MNELQVFTSEEFGSVRTVTIDNEPWFVGKDVALSLGYTNPQKAVRDHVLEEDRGMNEMDTPSGRQNLAVINESGLYALIFGSKLESAKRFKHWVTSEVLPSIRKTGGYQMNIPQGKELLALAVLEANKTIEEQQKKINEMHPKAVFADAVATSKQSILIGQLAKLICQNGVKIGQRRLFQWMRDNGYLMKQGSSYNMPKQRYVEQGLFEIKESSVNNPDGSVKLTMTTKVLPKGQIYFINKFMSKEGVHVMAKEQKVEAYSMILDGYTYQDIADKVGCTRQYIQKLFENVPKIRGISRKRYSSIIYPSIKRYMINHGLSYNEFSRIIYGTEKTPSELKKKLIGERSITLNEAKLIIKATGMTFEEAFRTEGETCSATTTQQRN